MRYLLIAIAVITLTACNEGGSSVDATLAPIDAAPPSDPFNPAPVPTTPPVAPQTAQVTIYTLTRTIAPSTSYPALTFTATASCVEYGGRQYCWDDGMHQTLGGPITFNDNYFGLQPHVATGSPQTCKLSCNASYMAPIRDVTAYRNLSMIVLGGTLGQEVDHILANGTPTLTSCTLENGTLTCGTLIINVSP